MGGAVWKWVHHQQRHSKIGRKRLVGFSQFPLGSTNSHNRHFFFTHFIFFFFSFFLFFFFGSGENLQCFFIKVFCCCLNATGVGIVNQVDCGKWPVLCREFCSIFMIWKRVELCLKRCAVDTVFDCLVLLRHFSKIARGLQKHAEYEDF